MSAQMKEFMAESAKQLSYEINRFIKRFDTSHVHIQIVTTVIPDQNSKTGARVLYEAFVTYPA